MRTKEQVGAQLGNYTLDQIAVMYREGRIDKRDAELYCELWNTSAFRFTTAKVIGVSIVQVNND